MQARAWIKGAVVLLAGTVLASAAQAQPMTRGGRPVGAPHPSELWKLWFGGGAASKSKLAIDKRTATRPAKAQPRPQPAQAQPAQPPASEDKPAAGKAADRFEREQRAFLRRLAVCDKIRQVALQTNDDNLFRKADQLQEQAWSLCLERTGMIPVDGQPSVDEEILDQHLGAGTRSARIDRLYTVPGPDNPTARPALAQEDEQ